MASYIHMYIRVTWDLSTWDSWDISTSHFWVYIGWFRNEDASAKQGFGNTPLGSSTLPTAWYFVCRFLGMHIQWRQCETQLIFTLQAIRAESMSEQQSIGRYADIALSAYRLIGWCSLIGLSVYRLMLAYGLIGLLADARLSAHRLIGWSSLIGFFYVLGHITRKRNLGLRA